MKRIYISFFTTVIIALTMTLIAFLERNNIDTTVRIDNHVRTTVQDSTLLEFTIADGLFN